MNMRPVTRSDPNQQSLPIRALNTSQVQQRSRHAYQPPPPHQWQAPTDSASAASNRPKAYALPPSSPPPLPPAAPKGCT